MDTQIWEVLSQYHLTLDQTSTPLEIERFEVEQFYYPLSLRLIHLERSQKRSLVAVAGPPGSGKTAFATLLTVVINAVQQREEAVLIQQDGWHYANAYLDTHTLYRDGKEITLRQLKGSPETYDTDAAYAFIKGIRAGEQLSYPVYSRGLHDPIPNAGRVTENHRIVILEGNYWLLNEDPWRQFQAFFDERIFLTASPESLTDGLRQRHLRGGKTDEFTQHHMDFVDIPDMKRVLKNSAAAQVVVHKVDSRYISSIKYIRL